MDHAETLASLHQLMQHYDGVVIDPLSGRGRVVLRIADSGSLARLVYSAGAANLGVHVWTTSRGELDADRADIRYLRYDILIPEEKGGDGEPPSNLQIMCAYMVWDLARRGVLERSEANRMLAAWNCVSVEEHFANFEGL